MNGAQQLTQAEQAEKVNAFLRAQGIETTVEDQIAAVAAQATRVEDTRRGAYYGPGLNRDLFVYSSINPASHTATEDAQMLRAKGYAPIRDTSVMVYGLPHRQVWFCPRAVAEARRRPANARPEQERQRIDSRETQGEVALTVNRSRRQVKAPAGPDQN